MLVILFCIPISIWGFVVFLFGNFSFAPKEATKKQKRLVGMILMLVVPVQILLYSLISNNFEYSLHITDIIEIVFLVSVLGGAIMLSKYVVKGPGKASTIKASPKSIPSKSERRRSGINFKRIFESKINRLISKLNEGTWQERNDAANALGELGDPHALEPLIAVINDKKSNEYVRQTAVRALGKLGDPRAFDLLIAVLKDERDDASSDAAAALGDLGDPRAFEPLLSVFFDKERMNLHMSLHYFVTQALGKLGDPRAIRPLISELVDGNDTGRGFAIDALVHLHNPDSIGPLISATGNHRPEARMAAAIVLGMIGDQRAIEPLKQMSLYSMVGMDETMAEFKVRAMAVEALKVVGKKGWTEIEFQQRKQALKYLHSMH